MLDADVVVPNGTRCSEMFPATTAEVALVIPDEQGIEHPLCLSNCGRRSDGSYVLGRVDCR